MKYLHVKLFFLLSFFLFERNASLAQTQWEDVEITFTSYDDAGNTLDSQIISNNVASLAPEIFNYSSLGITKFNIQNLPSSPYNTISFSIGLDVNGDGIISADLDFIEEFQTDNDELNGVIQLPATFNERSFLQLTLESTNTTIPALIIGTETYLQQGDPPLIATTRKNQKNKPWNTCLPFDNLLTIYIHNNDPVINYMLTDINIGLIDVYDGPTVEIPNDGISYDFLIDMSTFDFGFSGTIELFFEDIDDNPETDYSRKLSFTIGCCEMTDTTFNEGDTLPYFTSVEDFIVVDGNNFAEGGIGVESGESTYLQAENYISLLPGVEISPTSESVFKAYIKNCATEDNQTNIHTGLAYEENTPYPFNNETIQRIDKKDFLIYPIPFQETLNIQFQLEEKALVNLEFYTIMGQKIKTIIDNTFYEKGEVQYKIDTSSIPPGSYFYQLQIGDQIYLEKIIKL